MAEEARVAVAVKEERARVAVGKVATAAAAMVAALEALAVAWLAMVMVAVANRTTAAMAKHVVSLLATRANVTTRAVPVGTRRIARSRRARACVSLASTKKARAPRGSSRLL